MSMHVYKPKRIINFIVVLLAVIIMLDIASYYLLTYHEEIIIRVNRLSFLFKVSLVATVLLLVRLAYEFVNKNNPVIVFEDESIQVNIFLRNKCIYWSDVFSISVKKGKLFEQITFNLKKKGFGSLNRVCIKEVSISNNVISHIKQKGINISA